MIILGCKAGVHAFSIQETSILATWKIAKLMMRKQYVSGSMAVSIMAAIKKVRSMGKEFCRMVMAMYMMVAMSMEDAMARAQSHMPATAKVTPEASSEESCTAKASIVTPMEVCRRAPGRTTCSWTFPLKKSLSRNKSRLKVKAIDVLVLKNER